MPERLLRLTPSAAVQEKRLAALLAGREGERPRLLADVADAQLLGSLELAGFGFGWEQVAASRRGEPAPPEIGWLRQAQQAVAADAPIGAQALLAWHAAATGGSGRLRATEREREGGPQPAPARFVAGRLAILEEWLNSDSARGLKPAQAGALALARLIEILPFETANGRVARLAASHAMTRAGAHPPILVGADAPRLQEALGAAFQIVTEPLVALLEEASERALEVMIQSLQGRGR